MMGERRDDLNELRRLDRQGRVRSAKAHVQTALGQISDGYRNGRPPAELLRRLAVEIDRLVQALYRCADVPQTSMVSLVALGGYGRGELFPHSDLDLLVLQHQPQQDQELAQRIVEHVVYPLWDAGVSVGHAVRGIDEILDLSLEDLTARTSLLDARLMAGDEGPFHALEAGGIRRFFGPQRVQEFVVALHEERAKRHQRFGVTEYLLEPNVKQSKGGLRDLNTALWAAKARFGVDRFCRLADVGAGTQRQIRALSEARDFLCRLRLAMHLQAGRAQDHLSFELQECLAPQLFPEVDVPGIKRGTPAVAPAVERLMGAFYRHARAVVMESDGVLERCRLAGVDQTPDGAAVSDQEGEHFVLAHRRINSSEPARFWEEPAEILRAFSVALSNGVSVDRTTRDAIAEAVADVPGYQLMADERAAELWLELLCNPEREGVGTVLEEMHHLGIVGALIPEFDLCTGRIQHDLYHVYTVDLHSLYVVALLKAWMRGEQADDFPTPVTLMARMERLESLMLAALLHDVGKPLGHGHAVTGARLAAGVAARLGLAPSQQAEVTFLVREHLLMAHLSQRRDLSDPTVIASFAEQVETAERLRKLYLLTAADTAMTAPGNLTDWKATLLEELYIKTYRFLIHGREALDERRTRRLAERKDAVELSLRRSWGPQGGEIVGRVPDEMLLAFEASDLARHLGVALELASLPDAVLRVGTRSKEGGTELTVCCTDSPGRLAAITGVLLLCRIEVLGAQVYTLDPPGDSQGDPLVLDIFTVQPPQESGASLWNELSEMLEQALRGELMVEEQVRRRIRPSPIGERVLPRVPIEVSVDNEASDRFTVLEVKAPDRLGVLHGITQTLSRHGLTIHLSRVASEAGRVVDIFYVSDGDSGGKLVDEERLSDLRRTICDTIAMLESGNTPKQR